MGAALNELKPALNQMASAPLTLASASQLPNAAGIYQLLHDGVVKYVGKATAKAGLRARLAKHVWKFQSRHNIVPTSVHFRAVRVFVLKAMDIETELIKHYKPEWNGSNLGSNDPGRRREETNKPADGFDSQFPIDVDLPLSFVPAGALTVHALLISLKDNLPYCLRYETLSPQLSNGYKTAPHPDYSAASVNVPSPNMTTRSLLRLVAAALPPGWQATLFPSHVILYKESRTYTHGTII